MISKFLTTVSVLALLGGCINDLRIHEQYAPISGDLIRSIDGPSDEAGGVRVSGVQTFSRSRGGQMQDSAFFAGPGMAQTALGAAISAAGFAAGSMGGAALLRPAKIGGTTNTLTNTGGAVSNLATSAGSTATATGGAATGGTANAAGGSAAGGVATAAGGQGGAGGLGGAGGAGGAGGLGGAGGISSSYAKGGSSYSNAYSNASASAKLLNQQSFNFHVQNTVNGGTTCKGNCAPHDKKDY